MSDLQIIFPGLKKFQQVLQRASKLDKPELLDQMAQVMLEQARTRLDSTKESPDGDSWEPLSPEYAKTKKGNEILEERGSLLDSLQAVAGSDGVSLGSNLLYAAVHLYGDEERGIPARPYLGFSDDDLVELGEVAEAFLEGMFR